MELWELSCEHPETPLYSGGLMDAWPKWAVEAMKLCRQEEAAIRAMLESERQRNA